MTLNPDLGDAWSYYYAFELRQEAKSEDTSAAAGGTGNSGGVGGGGVGDTAENSGDSAGNINIYTAESILRRCVDADPHHGELWCAVAKSTAFRRAKVDVILKKVVEGILLEDKEHKL